MRTWSEWAPWAYVLLCAPLVLLLVEYLRGAVHETQMIQTLTLHKEMHRLQAQSERRAAGLAVLINSHEALDEPWPKLRNEPWLKDFWSSIETTPAPQLYSAVVDEAGRIVMHSDPERLDKRLERGWYERRVPQAGANVVSIERSVLSGDQPAFDVSAPVEAAGRWIGEFHEGLDARWLQQQVAAQQRAAGGRWFGVIAVALAVDLAAVGALVHLARRQSGLWRQIQSESRQRSVELAQIGSGLAHEIRNPLHALRINLHTLRRAFSGRSPLPSDQIVDTIQDSDTAIDRLDRLMRDLLQFADPSPGQLAEVDLVHEVQATLNLLAEDLRRDQVELRSRLPREPALVVVDPVRLRQALLNLLTFAQHRAGKSGVVDVAVKPGEGGVEIAVADSGPPIPHDQRAHLFEPFQAPAETGSGLGLALVQVYLEEAGGSASSNGEPSVGNRCRLWLPLASSGSKGGKS